MILPTTPMLFSSSHHSSFYRFRRNPAEFDMKNRPGRLICTYYTYRGESNHAAHVFAKTSRISEEQKVFAASPPKGIPRWIPPGKSWRTLKDITIDQHPSESPEMVTRRTCPISVIHWRVIKMRVNGDGWNPL